MQIIRAEMYRHSAYHAYVHALHTIAHEFCHVDYFFCLAPGTHDYQETIILPLPLIHSRTFTCRTENFAVFRIVFSVIQFGVRICFRIRFH